MRELQKKTGDSMKKNSKKKFWCLCLISIIIITVIGFIILFIKESNKTIEVYSLSQIQPLSAADSSKSVEMIKKNIVKIINKTDSSTSIIGTGFFDKSGYLVTNSHIVDIKGEITVEFADGTKKEAQLFSNDITSDIALLSVKNSKAKAMYFGKTLSLNITDEVYSIGYQYALKGEASVSKGILSARRSAGGIEFLQSDISLNIGNSGGPLINDKGELLGINTYATENASIGIAISSESLEIIIEKLIKEKKVNYLEDERPSNALSVVLKEIGYYQKDLYNEEKIIKKHTKRDENDKDNKKPVNENQKPNQGKNESTTIVKKIYKIDAKHDLSIGYFDNVPTSVDYYFNVNDNTNCNLNLGGAITSVPGIYNIEVICSNNTSKTTLRINEKKKIIIPSFTTNGMTIPELTIDESYYNITDKKALEGMWYMPGYNDICLKFYLDYGEWFYVEQGMTYWNGEIHGAEGGGGGFSLNKYEYYWITDKYLIVTEKNGKSHVYTREPGSVSYYGGTRNEQCQ